MNKFLSLLSLSSLALASTPALAQCYSSSYQSSAPMAYQPAPQTYQPQVMYQAAPMQGNCPGGQCMVLMQSPQSAPLAVPAQPMPQAAVPQASSSCYSSTYQPPPAVPPPVVYSVPSPAPRATYDAVYWPPPSTSQPYLAPIPLAPSRPRNPSRFAATTVVNVVAAPPRRPILGALRERLAGRIAGRAVVPVSPYAAPAPYLGGCPGGVCYVP